ncbi:MAG: pentapeptide repeat-containing protein [Pseudomonadota bacterium]
MAGKEEQASGPITGDTGPTADGDGIGLDDVLRTAAQASGAAGAASEFREEMREGSSTGFGIALGFVTFILGIALGIPLAFLAPSLVTEYGRFALAVILTVMFTMLLVLSILFLLRERLWQLIFRRGEVELKRFAEPLSEAAFGAADRQPERATKAARTFVEMALARYAWVSTRRWIVASITGLVAAIAALSGSALLFEQNRLLRAQSGLLEIQNERILEQNTLLTTQTSLLDTQTQLAEADRSAQIGPQIVQLGAALAAERQAFLDADGDPNLFSLANITAATRSRIAAATLIARPYRYLAPRNANPLDDNSLIATALQGREDAVIDPSKVSGVGDFDRTELIDRPVSPERGDLIALLVGNGLTDTEMLTIVGADFSFAQLRLEILPGLSLRHAKLSFADLSWMRIVSSRFGGAKLEHATIENAVIRQSDFSALTEETRSPLFSMDGVDALPAIMTGASFDRSVVVDTSFDGSFGIGVSFVDAALANTSFDAASIPVADFSNALIYQTDFAGALLQSVRLDDAIVLDAAFLDKLDDEAAPGTFVRERWALEPIPAGIVAEHPRYIELTNHVDVAQLVERQAFKVVRVEDDQGK